MSSHIKVQNWHQNTERSSMYFHLSQIFRMQVVILCPAPTKKKQEKCGKIHLPVDPPRSRSLNLCDSGAGKYQHGGESEELQKTQWFCPHNLGRYPKLPLSPPQFERNWFINCWWRVCGIFQGYVGEILEKPTLYYGRQGLPDFFWNISCDFFLNQPLHI